MRTLFLTHEQRLLYYQEPGYTEIILPMLKSGMLKEHCIYNYQREWRWLYSNYEKSSADKLEIRRKSVETQYKLLEKKFEEFKPELVVYIATWPSEAIRSTVFLELKNNFSFKLCSVISDHQETDTDSQTHDRCTINASDLTLILDSFSRTERIKSRAGIYSDFTNTDRVIFLPTIPLWDYFKPSKIKKYDVTLSGSLEGFRQNVYEELQRRGIKVHLSGGIFSHDKTLDLKDYAEEIAESKILVNTQTVSGRIQVKGRVSQTLSCGTFLLEQENPETREYLKGIPIEFWKDIDELESKITYFLKNEALREEVASNAHKLWKERYSIQKFIDAIVNGIQ